MSPERSKQLVPANFASLVAEIALGSASLQTFHTELVSTATRLLGAAGGGSFCVDRLGRGCFTSNLKDPKVALNELLLGSADFSVAEVQRALTSGTVVDEAVFSAQRKDALPFFREVVRPLGGSTVFRLRATQCGLSFFSFFPETKASFACFAAQAIPLLESAAPIIDLAHKLYLQTNGDAHGCLPRALTSELKLTVAEHRTMDLVLRGLTNPEIASVLGISTNTVRNRLAASFKKLGVSTRTEAAFVLRESCRSDNPIEPDLAVYQKILGARRVAIQHGLEAILVV
jgi:DNA-binding CsgD family transcriptional regulator